MSRVRSSLLAGTDAAKITPPPGFPMGGYPSRTHGCTGLLEDLWLKVLYLEDARGRALVVVGADLVFFPKSVTLRVRRRLARAFPGQTLTLLLNASHTHCGPHTAPNLLDSPGAAGRGYLNFLTDTTVAAIGHAYRERRPAVMRWRTARTRLAMNRRLITNGKCQFAPNPAGPTDTSVRVWSVHRTSASRQAAPLAVWFSYSCHPTTHAGYRISPDWPGFARQTIEKAIPGTQAIFTQGTCGELRPPWIRGRRGTPLEAETMGRRLGAVVLRSLRRGETIRQPRLQSASTTIRLPFVHWPTETELRGFARANVEAHWCREHLPHWSFLVRTRRLTRASHRLRQLWVARMRQVKRDRRWGTPLVLGATLVEFTPRHQLLALEGEICFDLAQQLRRHVNQRNLSILGYTNSGPAYIPSERILLEGGYEGAESQFVFSQPSPFMPGVEARVVRGARRLFRRLADATP